MVTVTRISIHDPQRTDTPPLGATKKASQSPLRVFPLPPGQGLPTLDVHSPETTSAPPTDPNSYLTRGRLHFPLILVLSLTSLATHNIPPLTTTRYLPSSCIVDPNPATTTPQPLIATLLPASSSPSSLPHQANPSTTRHHIILSTPTTHHPFPILSIPLLRPRAPMTPLPFVSSSTSFLPTSPCRLFNHPLPHLSTPLLSSG